MKARQHNCDFNRFLAENQRRLNIILHAVILTYLGHSIVMYIVNQYPCMVNLSPSS